MKLFRIPLIIMIGILLISACAPDILQISDVWARPGMQDGNSAIYFVIANKTGEDDTLLKAQTNVARSVELHMTMMSQGSGQQTNQTPQPEGMQNMQMVPQESVPVSANSKVEFKPGGLHVMLIGLNQNLQAGDEVNLTLTFEKAGEMTLTVPVKTME